MNPAKKQTWAGYDRCVDDGRASFTAPSKKQGLRNASAVRLPRPRPHSSKLYQLLWRWAPGRLHSATGRRAGAGRAGRTRSLIAREILRVLELVFRRRDLELRGRAVIARC